MPSHSSIALVSNSIQRVIDGNDLSFAEARITFALLLSHKLERANETSFGAFLAAIETKGATEEEITALVSVVLEEDRVKTLKTVDPYSLYGIVGSGKDEIKTYNISTAAALVAASCGVPVVKNGSRSDTSLAGATDLLEFLGCDVRMSIDDSIGLLEKTGFAFVDAEIAFPAMSREYVGKILFRNPLSYLLSIASGIPFKNIVFGISFDDTELVARLLIHVGCRRAMVVAGYDEEGHHFDEISSIGRTKITEIGLSGSMHTYDITPEELGFVRSNYDDIRQRSDIRESAALFLSVLRGEAPEAVSNIVAMNAGALLYISGTAPDLQRGAQLAARAIHDGAALSVLKRCSSGTPSVNKSSLL